MTPQQIRYKLEQLKGQRQQLSKDIQTTSKRMSQLKQEAVYAEDARAIIHEVAQTTQKELEYHISEIVTLALSAVFDNPYKMVLEFVQRRNRTEADILFEREKERIRPIDAAGGGAVDVAAFALRVAMWTLKRPRSRNTLILDEPLRFLSRDLMPRAAAMLSEVSKKLGLQIIMVSHSPELIEGADKYFEIEMRKGVSYVKEGSSVSENGSSDDTAQNHSGHPNSTGKKQQALDGYTQVGIPRGSERSGSGDATDIKKRSRNKQAVGGTRRTR